MREFQLGVMAILLSVIVWQIGDVKAYQVRTSQQIGKIAEILSLMNGVKP